MKHILLFGLSFFLCLLLQAQCGESGDICYLDMDQADMHLITFCPDNLEETLELTLSQFALLESDFLHVYQGEDTSGPLLASYDGVSATTYYGMASYQDQVFIGDAAGECITLDFVSDEYWSCAYGLPNPYGSPLGPGPLYYTVSCFCNNHTASFTMSDFFLCSNESTTVDFDASASMEQNGGTIVDYIWDFGDGTTGTGEIISHTYPQIEGLYVVSLIVIDDLGCETLLHDLVTISGIPAEEDYVIFPIPETICNASEFALNAFFVEPPTDGSFMILGELFWYLDGINVGAGVTTLESPQDPGVYEYILTYVDDLGCEYCLSSVVITIDESLNCNVETSIPDCAYLGIEVYVDLEAKVFLEGAYNTTGEMETNLEALVPIEQPYNVAPYNHLGEEEINIPIENVVDWVLVEIREGIPSLTSQNTTIVSTQAALLLENGDIVNSENGDPLRFTNLLENTDYHICIRHRNHLDILSAVPFTTSVVPTNASFDFTNAETSAWGSSQVKELEPGVYGLYAGDFNGEGLVQTTDFDLWFINPAVLATYAYTDANLDGTIQNTDYDLWFGNIAKVATPEVRYD